MTIDDEVIPVTSASHASTRIAVDSGMIRAAGSTSNNSTMSYFFTIDPLLPVFDERRRGKWYIHASTICVEGSMGAQTASGAAFKFNTLDAEGAEQNVRLNSTSDYTRKHYEVIIDWELKTVECYANAALLKSYTFSEFTGPVYIGMTSVNYRARAFAIDDMYFVIDLPDDPAPTGRPGACFVKAAPFTEVTSEKMHITPEEVLNTVTSGDATVATGGVLLSSGKDRLLFSGVAPVSDSVIAASVRAQGYIPPMVMVTGMNVDVGDQRIGPIELSSSAITLGLNEIITHDVDGIPLSDSNLDKLPVIGVSTAK
jgi:hypothetical protein